jgi:hypothetical protein
MGRGHMQTELPAADAVAYRGIINCRRTHAGNADSAKEQLNMKSLTRHIEVQS